MGNLSVLKFSMATFIIPLAFIAGSGAAIFFIVRKKIPYLRKLEESGFEPEGNFFRLMFSEIFSYLEKVDVESYEKRFYNEYEKFLRRIKVISLKIDNYANKWLEGLPADKNSQSDKENGVEERIEVMSENGIDEKLERFKKEEQSLIMEIAKNPKDPNLYGQLAEIYIQIGDKEDARESLKTGLELDPENLKIKELLGKIQHLVG